MLWPYWYRLPLLLCPPCWWAVFAGIALVAGAIGGCAGILLGHVLVACLVAAFDTEWIRSTMGEAGADTDLPFHIDTLLRAFLINAALLPVTMASLCLGTEMRRKRLEARGRTSKRRVP